MDLGRRSIVEWAESAPEEDASDFAIVAGMRELDRAWARLDSAARATTIAYTTEMRSEVYSERALHRLQGLEKDGW